jgi:hypothetical protein
MAFLKGASEDYKPVEEALLSLRRRIVPELSKEEIAQCPEPVWQTKSAFQCLIRRTVETADGVRLGWNADNLLTVVTMARSLIETAAIVRSLGDEVEKRVANKDIGDLKEFVLKTLFAVRYESLVSEQGAHKAQSILTLIDRMDESLFGRKEARLRDSYEYLCEFVHPNSYGILVLYSIPYLEEPRIEFGRAKEKETLILPHIGMALGMIWMVELVVSDFEVLVPQLVALSSG